MPGGDRKGPWGSGPRSGRGAGFCGGARAGGAASAPGGAGRGWRHWFFATGLPGFMRGGRGAWPAQTPQSTRTSLEDRAQALQQELDATRQQLNELSREPKGDPEENR